MKKIFFVIIISFCGFAGLAQQHEFSAGLGGGLSYLKYDLATGNRRPGLGGKFALGYRYFFTPNWGLGTGVDFGLYRSKVKWSQFADSYMTTDIDGNQFEFRTTINDFNERQRATILQIPLTLQYQSGNDDSQRRFYANIGAAVGFPLSGKYNNKTSLVNSGYYEYEIYEYTTDTFMGFGKFDNLKSNDKLTFNSPAIFASAELGVKWKLRDKIWLYTGAYLDYGLNNINNTAPTAASKPSIVEYNTAKPTDFTIHSVINSRYTHNGSAQSFVGDKLKPIAVGVIVRIAIGKASSKQSVADVSPVRHVEPVDEPTPTVIPVDTVPSFIPLVYNAEEEQTPQEEETQHIADEKARQEAEEAQKLADEKARREAVVQQLADEIARKEAEKKAAIEIIMSPVKDYPISQTAPAERQKRELDEKIALLKQYPDLKFYINGHTCELGTPQVNERIGLARAQNAKAYLLSKGIDESRILGLASKRDTEPLVPNISEENRKTNRRVEFVVE